MQKKEIKGENFSSMYKKRTHKKFRMLMIKENYTYQNDKRRRNKARTRILGKAAEEKKVPYLNSIVHVLKSRLTEYLSMGDYP